MTAREHRYPVTVEWTGNRGDGTTGYRDYGREHSIRAGAKPRIPGSADPAFRGDPMRWNPEELVVAAASACHQLWYLHLCADAGIAVQSYRDEAEGVMVEEPGGGHFVRILLRPHVQVRPGDDIARAQALHREAHARCYVANSLRCPVECEATVEPA